MMLLKTIIRPNSLLYGRVYVLSLLLIVCCSHQGLTQQNASIMGTVTDEYNHVVPGVHVFLEGTSYRGATDKDGSFTFTDLKKGNYVLKASSVGFINFEQNVSVKYDKPLKLLIQLVEEAELLDQIEITGKSEKQEIIEAPLAISLVNIEPLQNRNLDLQQALNRVAGVRVREEGGLGSGFNLSINGIGGRGVRYFIDGVPLENLGRSLQINNLPVTLIDRIEVYKGMIPVALGADALGGAVNIVTNQYRSNYLDASYSRGSFGTHKAAVNSRYTPNSSGFTVGINGYYNRADNDFLVEGQGVFVVEQGKRLPTTARRFHDEYSAYLGQIELGYLNKAWADRFLLSASYSGLNDETQHGVTMEEVFGDVREEETNKLLSLRYDKEFSSGLSLDIYGLYNSLDLIVIDTAARVYSWNGLYTPAPNQRVGEVFSYKTKASFTDETLLGRSNVSYKINANHELAFNILSSTTERTGRDPIRFPERSDDFYQEPATLTKMVSGISYQFKGLKSRLETNVSVKHFYYASLAIPPYGNVENQQDYKDQDYGIGAAVKYGILPGLSAKTSFERTLRLPAEDELFGDGLVVRPNPDLVPETSLNANFGFQYSREIKNSHNLLVNLNGFYRDISNQILATRFDIRFLINRNVREVRGLGGEIEVQYQFKDWLNLVHTSSFQDLRDNKKFEDDNSGVVRSNYRAILPNTPRFFSFTEVSFSSQNFFKQGDALSLYYNLNYVHEFFLTWAQAGSEREEFKNTIPTQWNHGAGINYSLEDGRYNVTFEVSNITDNLIYDNFALLKPRRAYSLKFRYFIRNLL
ncbi:MAG: TonB-dependent receptor [Bacteroidota bacterium]